MIFTPLSALTVALFVLSVHAQANIATHPLANSNTYFSDPYHVRYQNREGIYISGTTHQYLECDATLQPVCASSSPNDYDSDQAIKHAASSSGTHICGSAGIHPFQSVSGEKASWDAIVTLHVQSNPACDGISS